jgi:hypothetical protein
MTLAGDPVNHSGKVTPPTEEALRILQATNPNPNIERDQHFSSELPVAWRVTVSALVPCISI